MSSSKVFQQTTCPFCALACDDLTIKSDGAQLVTDRSLPAFCRSGFETAYTKSIPKPKQNGKTVAISTAIKAASELLKQAKKPLFGGLLTDIQGMRETLALARLCNGVIDHIDSETTAYNLSVLQSHGWITTTLSEIKRRSDLVIFIGSQLFEDYPRLIERISQEGRLIEFVFIGPWSDSNLPSAVTANSEIINVTTADIPNCLQQLSMLFHQLKNAPDSQNTQLPTDTLHRLINKIRKADYPTFIWSAKDIGEAHAEPSIALLTHLIKAINKKTRCVGLALRGNRGSGNMQSTCLWQTGYPGRVSFTPSECYYDPLHFSTTKMLSEHQTDLLIWISSLHPEPPPTCDIPTIALVHPALSPQLSCDLVIPIGIPGIDHAGYTYRTDGVVILPLKKLRDSTLPSLPKILREIRTEFRVRYDH